MQLKMEDFPTEQYPSALLSVVLEKVLASALRLWFIIRTEIIALNNYRTILKTEKMRYSHL